MLAKTALSVVAIRTLPSISDYPTLPATPSCGSCAMALSTLIDTACLGLLMDQQQRIDRSLDQPEAWLPVQIAPVRDALTMLLANAGRRTPAPSRLRLSTRIDHVDDGYWAVITIADRGAGLRRRELQHLFDPLQAPHGNTQSATRGPTLRLARRLIEGQGGWVEVRSALGIGTEVDIWLPTTAPIHPGAECA